MDHLYFVVHTHWDREWYQAFQRMRLRLVAMTDRMLPLLEEGRIPCFHFDGQTIVLEDYLELRPENARRIARLVRTGKLQVGPWYLLADSFLASGEALIRNLEIGARIADRFGKPLKVGYLPDQFGHAAQMPQILAGFGLKAAVVFRGVGREIDLNRFVWEGLDGSEIFTVYLPFGYFNGAALPSDSADALIARVGEIAQQERDFAGGAPILIMNGNDHADPDPGVFERLDEARARGALDFEVGTIEGYAQKLLALALDGAPRHRGELRSPARANLTPGVTSVRAWIKQRDFQNCYLLERIADPLVALARLKGRGAELEAFLDMAWRIEIQNHPHDSICGCSIDQVHQDMRYRFDQAAMIAENVVRDAVAAIFADQRGGEAAVAVFNPGFARRALVTGEVETEDPDASYVAIDGEGRRAPVAIDVTRKGRAFDFELPAANFKGLVAGISAAQVMGQFVKRYELRSTDQGRFDLDLFLSRSAGDAVDAQSFRRQLAEIPEQGSIRLHAMTSARARIGFVAEGLPQAGFSAYRLIREPHAAAGPVRGPATGSAEIDNEYYRLRASTRGLVIEDLGNGKTLELHFEDDGERGDEYNFDPVPATSAAAEPASISARILDQGVARSRLAMSLSYRLPASLAPGRDARAHETVNLPIELVATVYAGLDRVDFEVTVDNRARDHRLRAALSAPVAAREAISDTNFGIVRRMLEAAEPAGISEDVYPTAPHRTFTAVESSDFSVAMISRGLYETEVRRAAGGATILLTLLRCVGWLSRGDLKTRRGDAGPEMETPDAQEQGSHRFEFALTTWRGACGKSDVVQRSQAYAFPPRVFAARTGVDFAELSLCRCDNPRIVFSTARATGRPRGYMVRVFSASEAPETAKLSFGPGRIVRAVDLAGRPIKGVKLRRRRDGSVEFSFRPFQIATFEIRPRAAAKTEMETLSPLLSSSERFSSPSGDAHSDPLPRKAEGLAARLRSV